MTQDFYKAFEDRFRGSREQIKTRLNLYRPLLLSLHTGLSNPHAIDLGCGRGEWLEILGDTGFDAMGVDIDDAMLSDCHALGLKVKAGDAFELLQQTNDASVALVSAFHLVEHLPFASVLELIKQAHRVLVPGGLLIMESPNSENLGVGTWNFYLDPPRLRGF